MHIDLIASQRNNRRSTDCLLGDISYGQHFIRIETGQFVGQINASFQVSARRIDFDNNDILSLFDGTIDLAEQIISNHWFDDIIQFQADSLLFSPDRQTFS